MGEVVEEVVVKEQRRRTLYEIGDGQRKPGGMFSGREFEGDDWGMIVIQRRQNESDE